MTSSSRSAGQHPLETEDKVSTSDSEDNSEDDAQSDCSEMDDFVENS